MKKCLTFVMSILFSICMLFTTTAFGATTITTNQTGTDGLFYSFWTNGSGSASMTLNGGGSYSVNWSNIGDFTCGKGWSTGSGHTITYSGSYSNSGGGACGIYGWTTNPLIEYYICDSWNGVTYNATRVGSVTSDGSTYTIYKHQQVNQPSIQGTSTFWQYISVRDNQRVGGTITIQNHFDAWRNAGLNLGSMNYQILLVEGWNGSGSANITVSEGGNSGGNGGNGGNGGSGVTLNSWQCNNHSSNLNIWNGGIGGWNVGDWIEFNNVDLSGATYVNLNLASAQSGSYKIVTDSYNGTQIGTINFNSTGGWDTYTNQACNLNGVSGTHNLYVICTGGTANVGTITVGGSSGSAGGGSTGGANGNVYLTFDDGPNNGNSQTLINNLKSAGCDKATFFVIGQNISGNQTGWNAYKASGFSIQNHSQTHQHMTGWSYQQVYNDLNACNTAIQNGGASKPTKVRLPYLESNSTIQQACSALGLSVISPTVDTQDWNGANTQSIINACNSLNAGGNPLMHDIYQTTDSAISTIVQNLKNRGLGFAQY